MVFNVFRYNNSHFFIFIPKKIAAAVNPSGFGVALIKLVWYNSYIAQGGHLKEGLIVSGVLFL